MTRKSPNNEDASEVIVIWFWDAGITYLPSRWISWWSTSVRLAFWFSCFKLLVCNYTGTSSFMTSALDALVFVQVCVCVCVCVCWDYHRTVPQTLRMSQIVSNSLFLAIQCFGVCPSSKNPSSIHVHHFSSLYTTKIERIDAKNNGPWKMYLWFLKFGVIFGYLIIEFRAGAVKAWRLIPFAFGAPATAYGDSARLRSRNSFYIYIYRPKKLYDAQVSSRGTGGAHLGQAYGFPVLKWLDPQSSGNRRNTCLDANMFVHISIKDLADLKMKDTMWPMTLQLPVKGLESTISHPGHSKFWILLAWFHCRFLKVILLVRILSTVAFMACHEWHHLIIT